MSDSEVEEIAERLRRIAADVDPPPPEVVAASKAAFDWRTVDAELAELIYDSWLDDCALAGVRRAGGPRQLTFEAPGLTVEAEVVAGDRGQIVGQLVPAGPGVVEVRHQEGFMAAPVDMLGRFVVEPLPGGPISLRCRPRGSPIVDTDWITAY